MVTSGNREATGASEGRTFAELLDQFPFGWLSGEGCAEEAIEHGEETLGGSASQARRSDATNDFAGSEVDE